MKVSIFIFFHFVLWSFIGCSDRRSTADSEDRIQYDTDNSNYSENNTCKFEDGTHSATVEYYNSNTGYAATYTLDVEVENCMVIQINFSNGGWVDSDHITPSELDEEGTCTIDGEGGKTYEVTIDD